MLLIVTVINDSSSTSIQPTSYRGEDALKVLEENIYKYNSDEQRTNLREIGRRLSEENLLHDATVQSLMDCFLRLNFGVP